MTQDTHSTRGALSGPAERQFSEDGSHILERLEGSALLQDGLVNLIVLEPIAKRFAARWPLKRDAVYEHVERVLSRSVGQHGFFARVSDTDFLVVRPEARRFSALTACHRDFREIWQHFLGDAPHPGLSVHRVTELSQRSITAEPVEATEALAGEADEAKSPAPDCRVADAAMLSPLYWSPFVATDGRKVRVSCALEPVYSLRDQARIAFRLRRKVVDEATGARMSAQQVAALSRSDLLRIDMATITRGLVRLDGEVSDGPVLSLIVPVSYVSVANLQSRQVLSDALGKARRAVQTGIICEIHDAEDVPCGRLREAVSFIRHWCLLVTAHVRVTPTEGMKNAGLQSISVSCPSEIGGETEFIGWLRSFLRSGKQVARSVIVYRCGSLRRMAMAGVLGASHGSIGSDKSNRRAQSGFGDLDVSFSTRRTGT